MTILNITTEPRWDEDYNHFDIYCVTTRQPEPGNDIVTIDVPDDLLGELGRANEEYPAQPDERLVELYTIAYYAKREASKAAHAAFLEANPDYDHTAGIKSTFALLADVHRKRVEENEAEYRSLLSAYEETLSSIETLTDKLNEQHSILLREAVRVGKVFTLDYDRFGIPDRSYHLTLDEALAEARFTSETNRQLNNYIITPDGEYLDDMFGNLLSDEQVAERDESKTAYRAAQERNADND
jgi:hypothetical protein